MQYAAQVGYLATFPKDQKENRATLLGIEYPKPPEGTYLIQALVEMGWAANNGFGECPLSWVEIKSYADATGAISEPWEFRCVRDMSSAYVTERGHTEPLRIAPYDRTEKK